MYGDECEMELTTITEGRYMYAHNAMKGLSEAMSVHHIIIRRSRTRGLILCGYGLLFAVTCFLLPLQDKSVAVVIWSFALAGFVLRLLLGRQVERESVVIFSDFGVQLETFYASGETVRCFVPLGKILKPVLSECMNPVTCYWTLSLVTRAEEELLVVFRELYPPLSMLVPIWKALRAVTAIEHSTDVHFDRDPAKIY